MINKIKQIKDSRLKSEEIQFLELISELEEYKLYKYPNSVFWKKDNIILFEQDFNTMMLWVDYNNIWSTFEYKYDNKFNDVQLFIKNTVKKYLNWTGFTPTPLNGKSSYWWNNI